MSNHNLTEEKVKELHKLYESGLSLEEVATQGGTTRMTLSRRFDNMQLPIRGKGPKPYDERKTVIRGINWPCNSDTSKDMLCRVRSGILKKKKDDPKITMKAYLNDLLEKGLKIYEQSAPGTYSVIESDTFEHKRLNEPIRPLTAKKIDRIISTLKYKSDGHQFRFYSFSEFYVILIDLALNDTTK